MHDVVTVTLIILTTALLRWSLLTDSDAAPGVRIEGEENGFTTQVLVSARAERPHPARTKKTEL